MKAYELLDSPDKWTKGAFARDKDGATVPYEQLADDAAVCWCLDGALMKVYGVDTHRYNEMVDRIDRAIRADSLGRGGLWTFNDHATWPIIDALLRKLDI
jgi:hypothetical protein